MRPQAAGGRVAPNGAWEGLGKPHCYKQDAPLGLILMPMGRPAGRPLHFAIKRALGISQPSVALELWETHALSSYLAMDFQFAGFAW